MDKVWEARHPEGWSWVDWEVDTSVFNPESGETHLLSALPAEVLRTLLEGPASLPQLAGKLAVLCEVEDSPPWHSKIAAILEELGDLELIQRARQ